MSRPPDAPLLLLAALPWAAWLAFQIARLVWRGATGSEFAAWMRRKGLPARVAALCALLAVVAIGGNKGGGSAPQAVPPPPPMPAAPRAPEPSLAVVSVRTNGVAFHVATSSAVEVVAWRRTGGTEAGVWIESPTNAPLFAVGETPVFRAYASMSGAVSFESVRRPPLGRALPDGTGLPALCPLRAPLGFVPEANKGGASRPGEPLEPRFWHDALPGGGVVLTWEDVLVDRLPGRRASVQAELRPSGDCVFRYDFPDPLDPPPTNLVVGTQTGTNGVNALAILGTDTHSATVWRVKGGASPPGEPHFLADILCTNGVLRTPAAFEIRWKNTTGLVPGASAVADGRAVEVGSVTVWIQFPSEAEMMADPVVQAHASNLWAQTLAFCTPTNRHELGCWIRLDTSTDAYSFTDTIIGPPTPNYIDSGIALGLPPSDIPLFPNLQDGAAVYTVSSFHTHTPSAYRLGSPRIVGPSPNDTSASATLSMPGLVFDYIENAETPGRIPVGHPVDAHARLYPTSVCPRRTRQ